jgi:hypothetical protein
VSGASEPRQLVKHDTAHIRQLTIQHSKWRLSPSLERSGLQLVPSAELRNSYIIASDLNAPRAALIRLEAPKSGGIPAIGVETQPRQKEALSLQKPSRHHKGGIA